MDVEKDGFAKGKHLRVWAKLLVLEPLVWGFNLKSSPEDRMGVWFDFAYEKNPHFRFECGRLVHGKDDYVPHSELRGESGLGHLLDVQH